jgi:hypothetical protein
MRAMSPAKSRHLRKWKVVALVLLLGGAVFFGVPADRKYHHELRMKALLKAGGVPTESESGLSVRFNRGIRVDRELLQSHDYFTALEFQELEIGGADFTAGDIEALFRAHPLCSVDARDVPISAAAFAALKNKSMLRTLDVRGSGLSDADLAALPLEGIESLQIDNTQVTAQGLSALTRCTKLHQLSLDGSQFTDEVANMLRSFRLGSLSLSGPEVTDEHVLRLKDLTGVDVTDKHGRRLVSGLLFINLSRTSVSRDAIESLKAARPEFSINGP